jgi:hypothetical protein
MRDRKIRVTNQEDTPQARVFLGMLVDMVTKYLNLFFLERTNDKTPIKKIVLPTVLFLPYTRKVVENKGPYSLWLVQDNKLEGETWGTTRVFLHRELHPS